jgi:hypothetical protein
MVTAMPGHRTIPPGRTVRTTRPAAHDGRRRLEPGQDEGHLDFRGDVQHALGAEEHARAADVLRLRVMPLLLAPRPVSQRHVQGEPAGTRAAQAATT